MIVTASASNTFGVVIPLNVIGGATSDVTVNDVSPVADTAMLFEQFKMAEAACQKYLADGWQGGKQERHRMALPAYDQCIKASHVFNLLDARGVIAVTERQSYILRVRELAKACGAAWLKTEGGGAI